MPERPYIELGPEYGQSDSWTKWVALLALAFFVASVVIGRLGG